jgi:hypothetical protein
MTKLLGLAKDAKKKSNVEVCKRAKAKMLSLVIYKMEVKFTKTILIKKQNILNKFLLNI